MATRLVTPPSEEPVTLAEAKLHLRVTHTAEDALILALIEAARQYAEDYTWRRLITQTWDWFADGFPVNGVELPYPPLVSVESVKYVDTAGAEQTLASGLYQVDAASQPARLMPAYGETWPVTRCQMNAVTVRFVCGYGQAAQVPDRIKVAMLLLIGHWFNVREAVNIGNITSTLPLGAEALLTPYRVMRF